MIESFNAKSQKLEYYETRYISDQKKADSLLDPKYKHLDP